MADPRSIVPYHDPYDDPFNYDYLSCNDQNPTLSSLSSSITLRPESTDGNIAAVISSHINQPSLVPRSTTDENIAAVVSPYINQPSLVSQSTDDNIAAVVSPYMNQPTLFPQSTNDNVVDPNDPFDDPMVWNFSNCANDKGKSTEAGPSNQTHEQSANGSIGEDQVFHIGSPLSSWNISNNANDKRKSIEAVPSHQSYGQSSYGQISITGQTSNARRREDQIFHDGRAFSFWNSSNNANDKGKSVEAGPSHQSHGRSPHGFFPISGQTSNQRRDDDQIFGDGRPLTVWPRPPMPFQCTNCQVLREIMHADGNYTTNLEIHGQVGLISHAVLHIRDHFRVGHSEPQYRFYDFSNQSLENVKEFLQNYCDDRTDAGFVMLDDPFSSFYEALCVGYEWVDNLDYEDFFDSSPSSSEDYQEEYQPVAENDQKCKKRKSYLAQQRERAANLTLDDLKDYFHLPIDQAAKKMKLCPTVLKKTCRKYKLPRWPHRKVKSIQRQITNLQVLLNSIDPEDRARAQAEIVRLQAELIRVTSGPGPGSSSGASGSNG